MMDFIYELYQNDNFVLYLTIALVILIILFVLVLIFGKRDQKLEETKRLQKIEVDTFKEEKPVEEVKLEVPKEAKEEISASTDSENKANKVEKKSIFDDTQVLPIQNELPTAKIEDSKEINVTTFAPEPQDSSKFAEEEKENKAVSKKPLLANEEENKPIDLKELTEVQFNDLNLEKDLNELENIKSEFDSIKIPDLKTEDKKVEVKEEKKESKAYKSGPQIFSSVFVNKEESNIAEQKEIASEEVKKTVEKPKVNLFSIQDEEEEIELPSLKGANKKEETKETPKTFSFDDISGETYDIK